MSKLTKCFVVFISILFALPIIHIVLNSFMSESQLLESGLHFIPAEFSIQQYFEILTLKHSYFSLYKNSVFVVVMVILGQLLVSIFAGYAFGKMKFKGKNVLFVLYVVMMLLPYQVVMVPNVLLFNGIQNMFNIQIFDTYIPIILPGIFSIIGVFLVRQLTIDLPDEVIEAARLDGASERKIIFNVVLPMIKHGIIVLIILTFAENWNLIEQVLIYIDSDDKMLLSLHLEQIYAYEHNVFYAASLLYVFPIILIINYIHRKRSDILTYIQSSGRK